VLTAREFDLRDILLRHQKRVISRGILARDLWKDTARDSDTQLEFSLETAADKMRTAECVHRWAARLIRLF
jgi:DNA-binding winged helix-turn-helix (wHTH) protein